jgi:hypothetical protein
MTTKLKLALEASVRKADRPLAGDATRARLGQATRRSVSMTGHASREPECEDASVARGIANRLKHHG